MQSERIEIAMETFLRIVGECGPFQVFATVTICAVTLIPALHTFLLIFIGDQTDFWCSDWLNNTEFNYSNIDVINNCQPTDQINLNFSLSDKRIDLQKCSQWKFDTTKFHSSIISQYHLICGRDVFLPISTITLMAGQLLGAPSYRAVSNKIGRTRALALASMNTALCSLVSVLAPNIVSYVIIRFFIGFGASGFPSIGAAYLCEILSPKHRSVVLFNVFASAPPVAMALLVLSSYVQRSHYNLQFIIGSIAFVGSLLAIALPESPAWLLSQSRNNDAHGHLIKIARWNRKSPVITREMFEDVLQFSASNEENHVTSEQKGQLVHLLFTTNIRKTVFTSWFNIFACSLAYFSLAFDCRLFGWSIHGTILTMSILEILAHGLAFLTRGVDKVPLLYSFLLFAGLFSFATIPLYHIHINTDNPSNSSISSIGLVCMVLATRFFVIIAGTLNFAYCAAFFRVGATRESLIFSGMTMVRVAGFFAPLVFPMAKIMYPGAPFLLFGSMAIVGAVASYVGLKKLPRKPSSPDLVNLTENGNQELQMQSFIRS